MKPLLLILTFLSVLACCNDDDIDRTGGNTFSATFDGQLIEPERYSSGVIGGYSLYVNRFWENKNSWEIAISSSNNLNLTLWILDVNGKGNYPIQITVDPNDYINAYRYNSIYLMDETTVQYFALSLGNTGSFEITKYDSEKGILEGSFSCDMYDPQHPEIIKPITGSFKINMETHPNYN